jgi:UDP-2,3-diacylglucosamine pyrophosphatase LpxH
MVISKPAKSVTKIKLDSNSCTLLLLSDIHFDSAYCERKLLKETLDQALEKDAIIMFNGDFFDLMQSRNDRRGTKSSLRKEYLGDNYFDLVIDDAFNFLKPYAKNIAIMADGNHETAITKNYETNPLDRLCYILRKDGNSNVEHTGYQSWVNVHFEFEKNAFTSYNIKLHHGSGGNARVTKGVIEHNRMSSYVEGADLIWLGHTHTQYCMHNTVERLNNNSGFEVRLERVHHIRTGCWKQEYKEGGWSVEKGFSPSEIGGYWVELKASRITDEKKKRRVDIKTRIYPT